ncbi:hypothetical protein [Flavobacterium sp.]|uniref:hypothetical protein n=1 Tax=Flavobacterium sp. TaxID=239 RepID=UPI00262D415A|nr:hypothetical protein [Flavobacterium sp.]
MKVNLKRYLLYSSVFAIFTEAFFFNFIIDWKLFYLIILTNFILIAKHFGLRYSKRFFLLLGAISMHAIICCTTLLIPPNYFLSQILGITITSLYFYNVIPLIPMEHIRKVYVNLCFYSAIIGYIFYFLKIDTLAHFKNEFRLMSIFKEPAHYVVVVIPACYYYFKTKNYLRFFVVFISIVLSESSLGYIGCALMFLLPYINFRKLLYLVAISPILGIIFYYTYKNVDTFKLRVDETMENLNAVNNGKFDEYTNLSSYVFLSNLYITKQNFSEHPLGSGLGSHHHMYINHYYKNMRAPEYLKFLNHDKDNSYDANSLMNRMVSEFGILGILLVVFLLIKAYKKSFKTNDFLLQGIFIYFLLKLFRDGTYFPPELYFFVWLFILSNPQKPDQEKVLKTSL